MRDKELQSRVVQAQQGGSSACMLRAYLGLKVVAHHRHMVEQGVGKNLSGLIPFGAMTATALHVALKRGWLGLYFGACVCSQVGALMIQN